MWWSILLAFFAPICLHATSSKTTSQEVDPDLFRRDEQVFSGHGEFLFWWVEEGALDYAIVMRQDAWGSTPSFAQGTLEQSTYGGDPGLRLKLGYFRAPHYWEVWWQYTRLTGHGHNYVNKPSPDQQFVTGTWPQVLTAPLAKAESWLHLNYNVADFLADRYFNPNPHLRLRLLGGALVAWMNQNWEIQYTDAADRFTKIRSRWSYTGGGLRMGVMIDWFWAYDIYATILGTTGITLGSYHNQSKQTSSFQPTSADNPAIPLRDVHYSDIRVAYTAQVSIGPSWQKNWPHNRVELFAGYEVNAWFNLQEVYRSTSGSPSQAKETWINTSALALQGLTTRLSLDF